MNAKCAFGRGAARDRRLDWAELSKPHLGGKPADKGRVASRAARGASWPAGGLEGLGLRVLAAWVDASPDAITVLDGDFRILYANPVCSAIFGRPPDRLLGRDLLTLVPTRQWQTVRRHLEDIRGGKSEPLFGVIDRDDGSQLEVGVSGTVVHVEGRQFLVCTTRNLTQMKRQERRAAALAQAAAGVAVADSIETILQAISECVLAGTRALAAWVTLDGEDNKIESVGAASVLEGLREGLAVAAPAVISRCIHQQALSAGRVLVYADWRQQAEPVPRTDCALETLPAQPAAIVPLMHRGMPIGLLAAIYPEGEMPYASETAFLTVLGDQAVTAVTNARLLAAAREEITLEERQRLAGELHDTVSQSLYAIQVGAKLARDRLDEDQPAVAQPIDYVIRLAGASEAETRALIFELRPDLLESEGLVAALNRQLDAVRTRHGIPTQVISGVEPELSLAVKQALYRITQEALWNTVKHARAQRIDVRLAGDGDSVILEIADDGVGFDPTKSFPGHLGLVSMRERAAGVGGSLEVESAPGSGTRVVVTVPSALQNPSGREQARRGPSLDGPGRLGAGGRRNVRGTAGKCRQR
jgi:PAS domain S-box-containing protein